nr:MAG TPA: hypothetical protein [Caudoviricetes sp.]
MEILYNRNIRLYRRYAKKEVTKGEAKRPR